MTHKYIAMSPSGVWLVFDEQPMLRMSGWDGDIVATLDMKSVNSYAIWDKTLKQVGLEEYNKFYKEKEL